MKIEKIMLINPKNTLPKDSVRRLPTPLGLLYLASTLRNKYEIKILDSTCEGYYNAKIKGNYLTYGLSDEEVKKRIEEYKPDVVGITSMFTAQQINSITCANLVKSVCKNLPVVMGGIHPSLAPKEVIKNKSVDYIILGEGEFRFPNLLECLEHEKEPDFDGFISKKNFNPMKTRINDLDSIPFPSRDLIDMEEYIKIGVPYAPFPRKGRVEGLMATRGCPYQCNFCSTVQYWGRHFRTRSIENFLREVEQLKEDYDIQEIQFLDDNVSINKSHSKELFRKLRDYNLSICFPHGLMLKTMDKELIGLMAKAGAYQVSFAVESGSQRVLKEIIHKPVPVKKEVKKLVDICHDNDIQVHGLFIIGFIGETREEMDMTLNYPFETDFDSASFFIANPMFGSDLYQECKEKEYLKKDVKSDVKHAEIIIPKDSPDYVMAPEKLEELTDRKTREFNEFAKQKNPEAWDKKFKQFLKRHGKDSDLILGRVT